jgi:hypothetical protein
MNSDILLLPRIRSAGVVVVLPRHHRALPHEGSAHRSRLRSKAFPRTPLRSFPCYALFRRVATKMTQQLACNHNPHRPTSNSQQVVFSFAVRAQTFRLRFPHHVGKPPAAHRSIHAFSSRGCYLRRYVTSEPPTAPSSSPTTPPMWR